MPSDDHYATNVPNSEDSSLHPAEAFNGPREEVGEKIKAKREDLLCTEQGKAMTHQCGPRVGLRNTIKCASRLYGGYSEVGTRVLVLYGTVWWVL